MIRTTIATLATVWGLSMVLLASGQEAPSKSSTAKQTYCVSGGFCSRSWKVYSRHDTFRAAIAAASKLRSEKETGRRIVISTGGEPWPPPDLGASTYQVYSRACRTGWQPGLATKNLAEAKKDVEELTKNGRDAEIVYHVAERK